MMTPKQNELVALLEAGIERAKARGLTGRAFVAGCRDRVFFDSSLDLETLAGALELIDRLAELTANELDP
jgi:hypothetical protein